MVHIIFVHGMNATRKSWNTIPQSLESEADSVTAVTLPGHDNRIELMELAFRGRYDAGFGMEAYVQRVEEAFPAGTARNICLIGHSMGGAVISHVAAKNPERIAQLVYVTAMLPGSDETAQDIVKEAQNSPDTSAEGFIRDFAEYIDVIEFVQQPNEPLDAAITRKSDFDALRRGFVRCEKDNVIPKSVQDRMIGVYAGVGSGVSIRTLPCGHLPQFEKPQELTDAIKALLRE